MGAFDKAGDDVRAGLALFAESELSLAAGEEGPAAPALPDKIKTQLQSMAGEFERAAAAQKAAASISEADLDLAVEQAAASTRQVSATAQTTIPVDSPLGISLSDVHTTAYFFETQCCSLPPGSAQRFLATLWVSGCIAGEPSPLPLSHTPHQSSPLNPQPSTLNPHTLRQPSTLNPQPSILKPHCSVREQPRRARLRRAHQQRS